MKLERFSSGAAKEDEVVNNDGFDEFRVLVD